MPYISQGRRDCLDDPRHTHPVQRPTDVGELTYVLTRELASFLADTAQRSGGLSYASVATCLGALEGAKADLIRRVLDPLEERKQVENGDVWPKELLLARDHRG